MTQEQRQAVIAEIVENLFLLGLIDLDDSAYKSNSIDTSNC